MHEVPIVVVLLCVASAGIGWLGCWLDHQDWQREERAADPPSHVRVLDDEDLAEAIHRACPELFERSDPYDWVIDAGMTP